MSRARLFGIILVATFITLFSVVLVLRSSSQPAQADAPHEGLDFAIGIDVDGNGTNDCGTGVPRAVGDGAPDLVPVEVSNTTCTAAADATLDVRVYLIDNGGIAYGAAGSQVNYSGVVSNGRGTSVWRCHVLDYTANGATFENAASTIGVETKGHCNGPQTNVGLMNKFTFTCTDSGTISLGHDPGGTLLAEANLTEHREAGPDVLTIACGEEPVEVPGDSNCDGAINSIDATLVLQYSAGLIPTLPCSSAADVNDDGLVDSRDAALILQHTAGLCELHFDLCS